MLDLILGWAVIFFPTALAVAFIFRPARSENETAHMKWRYGLIAFGVFFSLLAWLQQSRATTTAANERESAIKETSARVATETADRVTKAMAQQYESTISGLNQQIGSLKSELTAANKASTERSERIAAGIEDTMKMQTGGDSYLYYECQMLGGPIEMDIPGARKGSFIINGIPHLVGRYPLHNVHVEVVGPSGWVLGGAARSSALEYGTLHPDEIGRSRQGLSLPFMPDKPKQFFNVFINTSNGSYEQTVLVQKVGDQWLWASRLYKTPGKSPLHTWAAKGFPQEELKPNASWD